jgi:hypothetical protein
MLAQNKYLIAGAAVAAVVALVLIQRVAKGAAQVAQDVGHAVDPTNQDNIFNRGVTAVGKSVTGKDNWSLGTQIYDWLHPDAPEVTGVQPAAEAPFGMTDTNGWD